MSCFQEIILVTYLSVLTFGQMQAQNLLRSLDPTYHQQHHHHANNSLTKPVLVPLRPGNVGMEMPERTWSAAGKYRYGFNVEAVPEGNFRKMKDTDMGKTAVFLVHGVKTELKSISVKNTSSDYLSKTIKDRLSGASRQAKNVIIDLRGQEGATLEVALRGVIRYFSQSAGNMQSVRVIGDGFDEVIPNLKARKK